MPERPVQHEIDELAQRAFRAALPPGWVVDTYTNDYAKDFMVEVANAGAITGDIFVVQLKGKRALRKRRGAEFFSVPISREHLRYYVELVRIPVFLVAVDVVTGEAFFEFMQRMVTEDPSISGRLHEPGRATLRASRRKRLSETQLLLTELADAWKFLNDRYPGSIEAAVRHRQTALKKLDSRFDYEISFAGGRQNVRLHALTPVECRVVVEGDSNLVPQQIDALIDEGRPLEAVGGLSIRVEGSPIFEGQKIARLEFMHSVPVEVRVFAEREGELCYFPEFRGNLSGGVRKCFFSAALPGCPLEIGLVLERADDGATVNFAWRWLPERWSGQAIRQLQWFEPIQRFFSCLALPGAHLGIEMATLGRQVFRQVVAHEMSAAIASAGRYVSLLQKARLVSDVLNLNATVPVDWRDVDFQDVEELYSLVTTGTHEFRNRWNLKCQLTGIPSGALTEFQKSSKGTFGLTPSPSTPIPYTFLGTSFDFAEVRQEFFDARSAKLRDVKSAEGLAHELTLRSFKRRYVWP